MTTASRLPRDARTLLRTLDEEPRTLPDLAATLNEEPGELERACSDLLASGQLVQFGDPTCPLLATPNAARRERVRASETLQRERRGKEVEAIRKHQSRARR